MGVETIRLRYKLVCCLLVLEDAQFVALPLTNVKSNKNKKIMTKNNCHNKDFLCWFLLTEFRGFGFHKEDSLVSMARKEN